MKKMYVSLLAVLFISSQALQADIQVNFTIPTPKLPPINLPTPAFLGTNPVRLTIASFLGLAVNFASIDIHGKRQKAQSKTQLSPLAQCSAACLGFYSGYLAYRSLANLSQLNFDHLNIENHTGEFIIKSFLGAFNVITVFGSISLAVLAIKNPLNFF